MTVPFSLARKIIAHTTSTSWRTVPHVCLTYEARVGALLDDLEKRNRDCCPEEKITLNAALLKIVTEGLKACPAMNGQIQYSPGLVRGSVKLCDNIDISMPVRFPDGRMMTVTLRGMEEKTLSQIQNAVTDILHRGENTDLNQAMYEVSIHDTLKELKGLHLMRALGRLWGFTLDGGWATLKRGRAKREYDFLPATMRLTGRDLEPGTVTVSNLGSLYPRWEGNCTLLEIVPPQLCAIGLGPVQEKPVVASDGTLAVGKVLPMTIAFDHRALDAGDVVPFLKKMDRIFEAPELLTGE